jgi:geranylgeranyl pyrophosphate synthase
MTTDFICQFQQRSEQQLQMLFESNDADTLQDAMRYSVLNGGKRVRPLLVYASGALFDTALSQLDTPAIAVELIHCYSLVHDDLPAMDNDDLRRGKPTCHKKFGEAIALLAGDALQTEAFMRLANDANNDAATRVKMLQVLAEAAGRLGMAGGQAIDLLATGGQLSLAQLQTMHQLKTGELIKASVLLGAIAASANTAEYAKLAVFADNIGLAFQIHDDILDIESDTATLGKKQGADQALNKVTYPALLGLVEAKKLAEQTYQAALAALSEFGEKAEPLRELANYIVRRNS